METKETFNLGKMSCKVKRKSQTPLNFRQFSFNYLKSIYSSSTWRRGRQEEGNDTCSHAESLLLPHMRYLLGGCSSRVQKAQSQLSTGLQARLRHDRENRLTWTRVGWGELRPAAERRWYCSRCTTSSPDLDAPVPLNVPWTLKSTVLEWRSHWICGSELTGKWTMLRHFTDIHRCKW